MNRNLVGPILIIIVGIGILFYNTIHFNLMLYVIPMILGVVIIGLLRNKIKFKINEYYTKNGIFSVSYDGKSVTGVAMKIVGKVEPNSNKNIDLERELRDLINAIARKDSEFKFAVITTIEKNKLGSSLIIYKIVDDNNELELDEFTEEINDLLALTKAVAPHLELKIIQSSKNVLPIPSAFGNYPFLMVSEITYSNPTNTNIVVEDFDIELGEATNGTMLTKVGIRTKDITRHIGIFGSTGSGKTNTSMILASQLNLKGVKVIIFDWHGEYSSLLKDRFIVYDENNIVQINPLYLIDLDVEDTVDIIGDVLQLTDPQRFLLYTILLKLRSFKRFSLNQMLEVINSIEDTSYWMRDVKYALLRKIFILFTPIATKLFYTTDETSLNNFLEYFKASSIINLSFISNLKLRRLYALFLIKLLIESHVRSKINQQTLIILDEAQNYFSKDGNEFMDRLASEIRKYNIGLCFITQSPSLLSQNVLKNTNIKIIHSIKSDVDKKAIKEALSLDERLTQSLDKLDIGEAIISSPNLKIPMIIKIKKIL
ncbi:helicase HerA-like domain-containing protein [Sulfolobus tengchongensis]|uniref:Helicase HerA-like domain-containing protein n=1 Tax=Sulfolobus tengchongensis TaxID=207809 RepID=A0AAX4KYQ8_9CREN